jgi:hypothetical protein
MNKTLILSTALFFCLQEPGKSSSLLDYLSPEFGIQQRMEENAQRVYYDESLDIQFIRLLRVQNIVKETFAICVYEEEEQETNVEIIDGIRKRISTYQGTGFCKFDAGNVEEMRTSTTFVFMGDIEEEEFLYKERITEITEIQSLPVDFSPLCYVEIFGFLPSGRLLNMEDDFRAYPNSSCSDSVESRMLMSP